MRLNKTIFFLAFLCAYTKVSAQLSTHEQPVSFDQKLKMTVLSKSSNPKVIMPSLDMAKIEAEDKVDEEYDMPPRFGYSHIVDYDLNNSGTWFELPNGDKLWLLEVVCPAALSVNFCYDKFWIPDGGKFFVYSKDRKHTIGAFTSRNNNGDKVNIRGFATELIHGNDVMLEYYQPKEVTTDAIISIKYIVHGYRYVRTRDSGYGASDICMVNINCGEGLNWQKEKKAVARVLLNNGFCSGFLIGTTSLNGEPFFLTANHCIKSDDKDAINNPNLDYSVFYWNYETPGCPNENIEPSNYLTTSGATIVANPGDTEGERSDFALLRLTDDPKTLSDYTPYYLGWDLSGSSGNPGVCIHHPRGDVKKISTILSPPIPSTYTQYNSFLSYWDVSFDQGVVNGCSSGSPLLNAAHRVIGQLSWRDTDGCNYRGHALYGRFDVSWTGSNIHVDSIHRRLDCWLDSLNTGVQTMDGLLAIPSTIVMTTNQQIDSNILITGTGKLAIHGNVILQDNYRMIVESGGQLIIENGGKLSNADLVLKPGAILEIKEGGILETRNGFDAPGGVYVCIYNGTIM